MNRFKDRGLRLNRNGRRQIHFVQAHLCGLKKRRLLKSEAVQQVPGLLVDPAKYAGNCVDSLLSLVSGIRNRCCNGIRMRIFMSNYIYFIILCHVLPPNTVHPCSNDTMFGLCVQSNPGFKIRTNS